MEEQEITPNRVTMVPASECPVLQFKFSAEDPDVGDTLTVRWYVDYPLDLGFAEQTLSPTGQTFRGETTFSVNLTSTLAFPLQFLQQPGTHVVEALLFDYRIDAARKPIPLSTAADGGIENLSYVVSYAWVVEVLRTCP
jgi:hypothetical protein